jgi:predicted ATP-dependent endonuclease of OLD family
MAHIIANIKVENFRSIKSESFILNNFTPLVGYNNGGKSNLLEAIKWLLRRTNLIESDFNDVTKPVIVEAKVIGLTTEIVEALEAKHKKKIEKFIKENSIQIRRSQNAPNSKENCSFDLLSDDGTWEVNPNGIDQSIQALFPDPIHIGAMENSEEDVSKNKAGTTIGKLLKDILEPLEAKYSSEVFNALKDINEQLSSEGTNRAKELTDFDDSVNTKINEFFPGVEIKVHIPNPEIKEVLGKGTIRVFEDNAVCGRDISSLGHGAQRSIQMALVRHLADVKRSSDNKFTNTLLLIDEPELYLHPQAVIILRESLKALSKNGYQVIFSTHSPFMINSVDIENTVFVRKDKANGTFTRPTIKSAIQQLKLDALSQIELIHDFSNSSNILFSDKVILAEGKTEKRVLPTIIEAITEKSLGENKIALVSLQGAGSLKRTMDVLTALGLPSKGVVDLDYAITKFRTHKLFDETNTDMLACKDYFKSMEAEFGLKLSDDGWPTKKGVIGSEEAFARLALDINLKPSLQSIISLFNSNNIWVWSNGAIENHLNIDAKNENHWLVFNQSVKEKGIVNTINGNFDYIKQFVNWIIN